jgi:hypothetical protein
MCVLLFLHSAGTWALARCVPLREDHHGSELQTLNENWSFESNSKEGFAVCGASNSAMTTSAQSQLKFVLQYDLIATQ